MLDLSNIFNKDIKKAILSKEQLAEMLKVTPEALEAFERSYQLHSMNDSTISDNLFKVNAKQAAGMNPKLDLSEKDIVQELIDQIVKELLAQVVMYSYDGNKGVIEDYRGNLDELLQVTPDDVNKLPEHLQPDLTGKYVKKDILGESGIFLLNEYQQYLNTKDRRKQKYLYESFRQGLDMMDLDPITYAILNRCQNSMGNWFPQLVEAVSQCDFFKLPKTKILKVPLPILQMSRLEYAELSPTTFRINDQFCQKAFELDVTKEYFIKTGVFSSKFDFRNAYVHGTDEVKEIGQYLLFISFQASCFAHYDLSNRKRIQPIIYGAATTNEWVVREFIKDKENNPCIYKGLPLHTEYRVFVDADTKEILGMNPYWDPAVMKQRFGKEADANDPDMVHDYVIYSAHEETLMKRYQENKKTVYNEVENLLPFLNLRGQWSMDIMQNGEDFYIIDMALAKDSALQSCVPKGMIKAVKEDWIPRISENYWSSERD